MYIRPSSFLYGDALRDVLSEGFPQTEDTPDALGSDALGSNVS
jgi:hypothetical protein